MYFEPQNVKTVPGKYTVDQLMAQVPASIDTLGYYATVTDLFGEKEDKLLCSKTGNTYFWQPVRPNYAKTLSAAAADMTLTALKSPSIIFVTGAVGAGVGRTITLSPQLAYPGASFEIAFDGTLGTLGTLSIAGLIGSSMLSMVLNGRRRVFYDGDASAWKAFQ